MSVINKMLRDLDASHRAGQSSVNGDPVLRNVTQGTVSLAPLNGDGRQVSHSRRWLWALLALAGLMALAWTFRNGVIPGMDSIAPPDAPNPPKSATAPTPVAAPTVRAGPSSATSAPLTVPSVDAVANIAVPISPAAVASGAGSGMRPLTTVPTPVVVPSLTNVAPAAAPRTNPASAPITKASATATAAVSGSGRSASARGQAAMDMLADAQGLWDRGAREAAIQMLRQKVDGTDSLTSAGGSVDVLWAWTRELTRMEMAEGRLATALERLIRLEPVLANQPVAWAMRANIAQRMGHHAESANAYLAALKIRPEEPRWLLGAAVSLAADGQINRAAEYAAKAQERGAMNTDVASFLRQQGVPLK